MPTKKATMKSAKPRKRKVSKPDFIRRFPNRPASEVIELAKQNGLRITDNQVYVVRSRDKAKKLKAVPSQLAEKDFERLLTVVDTSGTGKSTPGSGLTSSDLGQVESSVEQRILGIILEVGVARAAELFNEMLGRTMGLVKGRSGQ